MVVSGADMPPLRRRRAGSYSRPRAAGRFTLTSENNEATAGIPSPMGVHTLLSQQEADDVARAAGAKQGHGDLGLVPVMMFGAAPPWPPLAKPGARRPVVAVPDSGVQPHPWLSGRPGDPVIRHAAEFRWPDSRIPVTPGSRPYYFGHATFVAGLIRQTAPAAQILSVPIMGADGHVSPDASQEALSFLYNLVSSGIPEQFVDVICLAYGYEEDEPGPDPRTGPMKEALRKLSDRGVLIVTSAGNNGEKMPPTYPAAFAGETDPPVISVGATNPDGQYADYSNHGPWVTYSEIGSGVISTIPAYDGDKTLPPPPDPLAPAPAPAV